MLEGHANDEQRSQRGCIGVQKMGSYSCASPKAGGGVKALVLAAGAGTRLRPLTLSRPKPMVPVVNCPNIGHVLNKLSQAGIKHAAINLHMEPEQIKRYVGTGKKWNIEVRYSYEKKLLGTAGSLIPLKSFFADSSFFILSGDGISEFSLLELAAYHKRQKAIATIVLAITDARFEYGLVTVNGNNRVQAFIEKPSWGELVSPYINTGIYILEPEILKWFPKNGPFDFARDLWPKLLAAGIPIAVYKMDSYWCDIGNLSEYKRCQRDILDGKTKITPPGEQVKPGVWIGRGSRIASQVHLEGPLAIGEDVMIEKNAKILPYSVIGDQCRIGPNAVIDESVLWDKVRIASGVRVSGCVLADRTDLKESVAFYEGAIIGANV